MKKSRIEKALITIICILFLFTAITNSILAINTCHSKHCLSSSCSICMIIENAVNFINILGTILICIILLGGTVPLTRLIENTISNLRKFSLIEYQVQHNE